ncbi:polynucleotide 5'-hydroxyl-kinase NOL9 [Pseudomyrmex gracilis]|uniref:polynucleotide 5'-hydroxyl-kinase NOL9 n=1 Tax=Pseudomyrmex gracilis TaxID=219809 RepID=UPI000995A900|nr:polynucleotide 5'-hydroxyl-kinase NOL9 [Pseudomyrmex gracilis]
MFEAVRKIEKRRKKVAELKARQIKTKLAKSKTQFVKKLKRNQLYKPKNMSSCKIVADDLVNSENIDDDDDDDNNDDDQKLYSTDHRTSTAKKAVTPSNLKNKRKQSNSRENSNHESSSSLEHVTIDTTEWGTFEQSSDVDDDWKLILSDEDTDDWTQIDLKEKRDTSVLPVVDMLSENIVSLELSSQIRENDQTPKLAKKLSHKKDAHKVNKTSDKEDSRVLNVKSHNRRRRSRTQAKPEKRTFPARSRSDVSVEDDSNVIENTTVEISSLDSDTLEDTSFRSTNKNSMYKDLVGSTPRKSPTKSRSAGRNDNIRAYNRTYSNSNIRSLTRSSKEPAVYCLKNIVIVIMEKNSKFWFNGKLLIKVLYGAVNVYGFVLDSSGGTKEMYSPKGFSLVGIQTSAEKPSENNIEDVWTTLAERGITRDSESKLQADIDGVRPGSVIFVLQNFDNNLTLFLKNHFPYVKLFPEIKQSYYHSWTDPKRARTVLQTNLYFQKHDNYENLFNYKPLIVDFSITMKTATKMLNRWRANEWSCTLIAGGKNVGKSTFAKCLINCLLRTSEKVVLVDLDPGQAECTPPGCISYSLIEEPLLGPNFTHLKTPVYQLFLDDVNISRCVTRYLEGVKMLIERLKSCPVLSRLPIVVNTMGFTQDIGWNIMIFTIKLIRPSIILQLSSKKEQENFPDNLNSEVVNKQEFTWEFFDENFIDWNRPCEHELCLLRSWANELQVQTNKWSMEPFQQRELVMMSYLSDIIPNKDDSFHRTDQVAFRSINEVTPYSAPFSSLCVIPQRLFGVPASHVLNIINGKIVALCGIDLTEESSQVSEDVLSLRVLTQRSPLCTCYGFGIIRGVDVARQEVFINTPLPLSMMQYVNCLAGCIPVPPPLLQLRQNAPYTDGNPVLPLSQDHRRRHTRMRFHKKTNK